jgi:trimeric autotransporter adhesin
MSTKTTFKRIALVTVAALGFGVMSVAPSQAEPLGVTSTLSASTTTITVGETAKTTLTTGGYLATGDSITTTVKFTDFSGVSAAGLTWAVTGANTPNWTAVDTTTAYTGGSAGASHQAVTNTAGDSKTVVVGLDGLTAKIVSTRTTLSVAPTAVGTYIYTVFTHKVNAANGTVAAGTAISQTWTVVVTAPALDATDVFITTATAAGTAATADSTVAALTASATLAAAAVARIDVTQLDALEAGLSANYAKSIVVAVSGAGTLSAAGAADASRGASVVVAAGTETTAQVGTTAGYTDFFLHADGRSGKATITVTVNGALVATKEFLFFGALASYSVKAAAANIGKGEVVAHTVTGLDASKNIATLGTIYAESSDKTVATVAVVGGVVNVTGVAVGTATITIGNKAVLADSTIKTTVTATVLPVTSPTIAWSFDKDSYEAGEKMTLTITAAGIADGARAVFASLPTTNFTPSGTAPVWTLTPKFVSGVSTVTIYAPSTSGTFTVSTSLGQAIDTEVALKKAADAADAAAVPAVTTASYAATKVTKSAVVTNPALVAAQEATDAANEATDAGNNAKDAADQAIEAADAATIAAQDAAAAAEAAGEMAVEAAEAAGAIAQDALDAANAATDAALSAAEAADAATAAATEAKESADAATAAVAELSAEVAKLMAGLTAKVTTLSNLVAKIAKKVKA